MAQYGKESREALATCDPRLQEIFNEAIKVIDLKVLQGHRNEPDQNAAFERDASKLKWPFGEHNDEPSKAVDVVPFPVNWEDLPRFWFMAGVVFGIAHKLGYKIRWGRDWDQDMDFNDQKFNDFPHFEVVD